MPIFRSQVTIIILVICTWNPVKTDFISLISSPKGDFCITNSSSAMYYTTKKGKVNTVSLRRPRSPSGICGFGDKDYGNCAVEFETEDWKSKKGNTLILDERWEALPIETFPFTVEGELSFVTLFEWKNTEDFKISMSLSGSEAHLLLCDNDVIKEANCYWFALQAWGQNSTAMRRCNAGDITGLYPNGACEKKQVEIDHLKDSPLYMNRKSWSHIIIERQGSDLYLKRYHKGQEEQILHYSEGGTMFDINYLLGHRKKTVTTYKMHDNFYMQTTSISTTTFRKFIDIGNKNRICISLLLNTCKDCYTILYFMDTTGNQLLRQELPPTEGTWKAHKIIMDVKKVVDFIKIKIDTELGQQQQTKEVFWFFDNVGTCFEKEYRITQKDVDKFLECRLVENDQIARMEDDTNHIPVIDNTCSIGSSVGSACIACDIWKDRTSCEKLKICENVNGSSGCYCSPGYTGTECNEECLGGTYGYHCEGRCGFCKGTCNVVDGSCDCKSYFESPTCHIPKRGQYLKNPPKVVGNTTDSCVIEWDANNYFGKTDPKFYLIQYRNVSDKVLKWIDYGEIEEIGRSTKATIGELDSSMQYLVRILVNDQRSGMKTLSNQNLPTSICNTTCNAWKEDDIEIETTSNSAIINLKLSKDRCNMNAFTYKLLNDSTFGQPSTHWTIPRLRSFTNYTIEFSSNSQTIIKKFTTQEGVPSKVRNIHVKESTTQYLSLQWEPPEEANGIIEKYRITFQKLMRISCDGIKENPEEINTTQTSVMLHNLKPYSIYKVEIFAFNRLHSSEGTDNEFPTAEIDNFSEEEGLEQIKIKNQTSETTAHFEMQNIECRNLLGPLNVSIQYRCSSKWCLNTKKFVVTRSLSR